MAGIPLNTFKNINRPLTGNNTVIYSTATGLTSIVLLAQATNIDNADVVHNVTMKHYKPGVNLNLKPGDLVDANLNTSSTTIIVNNAPIPPNDSLILLGGKLVLETFDFISAESDGIEVHFIGSVLETANQ
jgi:hypothetical protein